MQVMIEQLETALSKIKYGISGYSASDHKDMKVTIEFVAADPGKGVMVDCMLVKAYAPAKEGQTKDVSMTVEIFPASEQQPPRASKTESFIITDKY